MNDRSFDWQRFYLNKKLCSLLRLLSSCYWPLFNPYNPVEVIPEFLLDAQSPNGRHVFSYVAD